MNRRDLMDDKPVINDSNICITLFLIFLVLKLTKLINWSWIWVFLPLIIEIVFTLLMIFIIFRQERSK